MKKLIACFSAAACLALAILVIPHAGASNSPAQPARAPMPDMIVDSEMLSQHWVVRDEYMAADRCSAIEGNITPGDRKIIRFTVSTPNIGDADMVVGDPNLHVADGLFEFATCHNHHHFRNYATYELIDSAGRVWKAAKRGFCMIDIAKYKGYTGAAPNQRQFVSCGLIGVPGNQGVSRGWADIYEWKLAGQFFVLDGGDGQPVVPAGRYKIRITVNPGYVPAKNEICRFADPNRKGVCHALPESNYENNVGEVTLDIPEHPGRSGVGPLKNEPAVDRDYLKGDDNHDH